MLIRKLNMKKIISATFFIAISFLANGLFAQEMPASQLKSFQTDQLKAFNKNDYNKCFNIKEASYDLLSLSIRHERKNNFASLINATTDINRTCGYETPLMTAARFGRVEMAKTLVKKGADKSLKNSSGDTAKEIALKNNHPELAQIL
jgi:hypothetical protein